MNRWPTPVRIQIDAAECGAACLGILLEYFGSYVAAAELRAKCEVSREGSSAAGIIGAAKSYGLDGKGFRVELDKIQSFSMPVIIHWRMCHFVVLERIARQAVWINDPASGRRRITWREFDECFTGIVLQFKPSSDFQSSGRRPSFVSSLWRRTKGVREALLYCMLTAVLGVLPLLVFAIGSQLFIDKCIIQGNMPFARPLTWILLASIAAQAILVWLRSTTLQRARSQTALRLSQHYLRSLLAKDLIFFTRRYPAELASRVTLSDDVASAITRELTDAVCDLCSGLLVLLCLFAIDVRIASAVAALFLLNCWITKRFGTIRSEWSQQLGHSEGQLNGKVIEATDTIDSMRASAMERFVFERWHHFLRQATQHRIHLQKSSAWLVSLTGLVTSLITTVVIGGGSYLVISGALSIGSLVAFQILLPFVLKPLTSFVMIASKLQLVAADWTRLEDVTAGESPIDFNGSLPSIATNTSGQVYSPGQTATSSQTFTTEQVASLTSAPELEVRGVCFGYGFDPCKTLKDVSFTLPSGHWLGIAGTSGSGKSTLARLVARLYEPSLGSMFVNGTDVGDFDDDTWKQTVVYIDQQSTLPRGTLREHLNFGPITSDDDRILFVLQQLGMRDTISRLPLGLGSPLGDFGQFSGGEIQRLEIARAILQQPVLQVLDEATAGLDSETEQSVLTALKASRATTIFVTHRPAVLAACDSVLHLRSGQAQSLGRHDELLEMDSDYRKLVGEAE